VLYFPSNQRPRPRPWRRRRDHNPGDNSGDEEPKGGPAVCIGCKY
jgi:hypothetical protein